MTDPVFRGLREGLKPVDTISTRDLALIGIDANLSRLERLHERTADAAERQAAALELISALLASVIGVSTAFCPGEPDQSPTVNFIRSGEGRTFRCDQNPDND